MPGPCHREGSKCAASSSSEGEFFPYLPPGDPTRIDDCALLNFPHEVAQVGGEEQQMGNPRQINKGEGQGHREDKSFAHLFIIAFASNCS